MMGLSITIPGRRRRAMALGLLIAAAALCSLALAAPLWLAHRHYDSALEELIQRLERGERLAEARPALEKKLDDVKSQNSRRFFLKATGGSLAAAEVQEQVRRVVEGSGARVSSIQVAQPKEDGGFLQLGVSGQFSANAAALRRVLTSLDAAEPYLFVEALSIRSQVPPNFKAPPGFEPEMYVQLDVIAYAIKGATP